MTLIEAYGRLSLSIRPHLRAFVASKDNKNLYINDLIEKDFKTPAMVLDKYFVKNAPKSVKVKGNK